VAQVTVNGIPIGYEVRGGGEPTLCLVHGSGGSRAVWIRQLDGLADVARVIALDLPGHGESGGTGVGTIDTAAGVIHGFLDALGLSAVVLGGHSMGGAVAQAFALAHPERLVGLVLVGTGARLRVLPRIFAELEGDYPHGVRFVVELATATDAPPALKAALVRQTLPVPPPVLVGDFRACQAFDVMNRIGAIAVPTLVLSGADDRLTPPKYARYLRDEIRGARLVLVEGAGHYVQVERAAETTLALREFLGALAARRPNDEPS
jgi:pimeloyl-ACP methyl ester carboxylesterase